MSILDLLTKKRHGHPHTREEIVTLVAGLMDGSVADYQMSAWLMAACIQGLSLDEAAWLTEAYVASGKRLDLGKVDGVVVDKHSTGGVGDKATLVLVPLLAAAGLKVAKLSGRGLGFTGGTIDKLEAIPGFQCQLDEAAFIGQLQRVGCVIGSQSADLTPADAKTYALRDVTATVDNTALIAASVVSKKIAAGAQVIVLDIKYGRGAFMPTQQAAQELADWCRAIGQRLGVSLQTVLSSMEQPLGQAVGNSLEVMEAVATLKGQGPCDLEALCLELGAIAMIEAETLQNARAPQNREQALAQAEAHLKTLLSNGKALACFTALIEAQGGDTTFLDERSDGLESAPVQEALAASQGGLITAIDPLLIAEGVRELGGGRLRKTDVIDPRVGVILHKKAGDAVDKDEALLTIHAASPLTSQQRERFLKAFSLN